MAVSVTNSPIVAFNTVTAITSNLATADSDNLAEVFTITPTAADGKLLILFKNSNLLQTVAATNDSTFSMAAGDMWQVKAVTGTITVDTDKMIQVETAKVLQDDGTILLTVTPGTADKLLANNALAIVVYELL